MSTITKCIHDPACYRRSYWCVQLDEIIENKMTSFNLGVSPIDDEMAVGMKSALRMSSALTSLTFLNSRMTAVGAREIAKGLASNTSLLSFRLIQRSFPDDLSDLGEEGAIALAEAIAHHPTLQTLILQNTPITPEVILAFRRTLETNQSLTSLQFKQPSGDHPLSKDPEILERLRQNQEAFAAKMAAAVTYEIEIVIE